MSVELLDDDLEYNANELTAEEVKKINLVKIDLNESIKHIKNGRNALIALCILTLIALGLGLIKDVDNVTTWEIVLEGVLFITIYGACAYSVKFNPRVALLIGFLIYILMIILYAVIDMRTLYSGFIIKFLMLYYFWKAINFSGQFKKNLIKLRGMGVALEELDDARNLKEIPRTIRD